MTRSATMTLMCAGMLSVAVGLSVASAQSSPPIGEQQFVPQAALANMAEIQIGHLATKKARNADVKKFAQLMIDDHVKAQSQLADAAAGANIQWPRQLDQKHQQIQQRLATMSTEQFDREYMKAVIDGHRDVEKLLAARVGEGRSERLRTRPSSDAQSEDSVVSARVSEWATRTLPAVRAHLKQAEQIFARLEKGV